MCPHCISSPPYYNILKFYSLRSILTFGVQDVSIWIYLMTSHKLINKAGFSLHILNFQKSQEKNLAIKHHLLTLKQCLFSFFFFLSFSYLGNFMIFTLPKLWSFVLLIEEWGGKNKIAFEIESRVKLRELKIRYQRAVKSAMTTQTVPCAAMENGEIINTQTPKS